MLYIVYGGVRPTGILKARGPPAAESFEGTNCGATPRKVPPASGTNAQRSKYTAECLN